MTNEFTDYPQFYLLASRNTPFSSPNEYYYAKACPIDQGPTNSSRDAQVLSVDHSTAIVRLYEHTVERGLRLAAIYRNGVVEIGLASIYSLDSRVEARRLMPLIAATLATLDRVYRDAAEPIAACSVCGKYDCEVDHAPPPPPVVITPKTLQEELDRASRDEAEVTAECEMPVPTGPNLA